VATIEGTRHLFNSLDKIVLGLIMFVIKAALRSAQRFCSVFDRTKFPCETFHNELSENVL
jgi:hypothetical protein